MKPSIQLHIANPCHENWDAMTPIAKGKFCSSCSKEVVDFSLLTDAEVLNFFKKASGNTCGRFYSDQLQRPLQKTKIEKKKGIQWLLASIASILMISKSQAQKKESSVQLQGKVACVKEQPVKPATKGEPRLLVGDTILVDTTKKPHTAPGKNTTTTKPLKGAVTKILTGQPQKPAVSILKDTVAGFAVSAVLPLLKNTNEPDISYECRTVMSGSISVTTTFEKPVFNKIIPAAGVVRKLMDTLKITNNIFKIYPNPVQRNSPVHLMVKDAGNYQFELFDNSSRLLNVRENTSSGKNQIIDMQLPGNLSAGIYYIRMINLRTGKAYVDKLIVH